MATLTRGLDAASKAALAAALEDPIFEVLPLKNLPDQIPHLPAGARVSVTASCQPAAATLSASDAASARARCSTDALDTLS